jgi:replicative DNA helicase
MAELRVPPHNLDLERSLLGALMIDEDVIYKVIDILSEDIFYDKKHKLIFEAMMSLYNHQKPIDLLTVSSELKKKTKLKEAGGNLYLTDLVESVPTSAHSEEYAKIIKDLGIRRKLISLAGTLNEYAYKEDEKLDNQIDEIEKKLLNISEGNSKNDFVHVAELLEESYKKQEELNKDPDKIRGVRTGFTYLDNILGGLQDSDLIILAARPSVGKSAFAFDLARYASVYESKRVGIFSLEMSNIQVMDRILSMQVGVGLWDLRMGKLHDEALARLSDAMGILSETGLYVDDTPGIGIMEMRAKARRLKFEKGLDLIIVDYLQLINGTRMESRVQEVSEISRSLKSLARELDVPVLALSQLSRAVEQRSDNKPQLSDLRDSGSIEQDADVVIFLSRSGGDDDQNQNRMLTIAKHRNGPTGLVELFFVKEQARFREIEKSTSDVATE